ncbi:MAG: MFS transporter [bacterium]
MSGKRASPITRIAGAGTAGRGASEAASRRRLTAAALYSYFVTGIVYTIIGPSLPTMGAAFDASIAVQGLVFTCMFGGNMASVLLGGVFVDAAGEKRVLTLGTAVLAAGLAAVGTAAGWTTVLAGFLAMGVGLGCIDVGNNALVARVNPSAPARHLGVLHAAFSIGAVLGPHFAGALLIGTEGFRAAYLLAAALPLAGLAVFAAVPFPPAGGAGRVDSAAIRRVLLEPRYLLLCAVLLISMGCEMCMNGWIYTYLRKGMDAAVVAASGGVSLFWLGLFAGRVAGSLIVERIGLRRLMTALVVGAAAAIVCLALAPGAGVALAMAFVVGLFFSSQFPIVVALGAEDSPDAPGAAVGGLFAMGGLGGTLIPAGAALVAERASLRAGLGACAPVMALAAVLIAIQGKLGRRN